VGASARPLRKKSQMTSRKTPFLPCSRRGPAPARWTPRAWVSAATRRAVIHYFRRRPDGAELLAADVDVDALPAEPDESGDKYEPRWRRRQATMVLLLLLGAVAVAVLVSLLLRPTRAEIRPDPTPPALVPAPSATASAQDTPFEPALPTRPAPPRGQPEKPQGPPKP
jgi:hypothetical protein